MAFHNPTTILQWKQRSGLIVNSTTTSTSTSFLRVRSNLFFSVLILDEVVTNCLFCCAWMECYLEGGKDTLLITVICMHHIGLWLYSETLQFGNGYHISSSMSKLRLIYPLSCHFESWMWHNGLPHFLHIITNIYI